MRGRIAKWRKSFRYAYEGLKYAFVTQRNMKFHVSIAFLVLLAAWVLNLSRSDILFILVAITLMFVTELVNTAVEKAVDLVTSEQHPLAKIAKDTAAAAVLVSAIFAFVVGIIVFYEPINQWFLLAHQELREVNVGRVGILITLIGLMVFVIEARFAIKKRTFLKPSLFASLAFAMATVIALIVKLTIVALLAYTLSTMIVAVLFDKKTRSSISLMFGAILGILITILLFMLMYLF